MIDVSLRAGQSEVKRMKKIKTNKSSRISVNMELR